VLRTGAVQDERAVGGRLLCELADEPTLARAGLAADEREAQAVAAGAGDQGAQGAQLALASREREGGREAQWSGEPGHGERLVRSDHLSV
jgi:hypothetical protein